MCSLEKNKADAVYRLIDRHFEETEIEQISDRKFPSSVRARWWGMYLMHKCYGWSFSKIGKWYGDRHYTTVANAVHKMARLVERSASDANLFLLLQSELGVR